jgi:uncharacterized protein (DUF427 family)
MKFDYNKKEFTQEEKEILLKESKALLEKYPDRIPLLVQLDSNVLKLEKHKFLVNDDININYYIDVLKTKLIHINSNDSLTISLTKFNDDGTKTMTRIKPQSKLLKEFYQENKDPSTGMLIFTVSRQTTVKWVKGLASYYLGY